MVNEDENVPHELNSEIQKSIEDIIGAKTTLKKKRRNTNDIARADFIQMINHIELVNNREILAGGLEIDLSSYSEKFYNIIDQMIFMMYGKEAAQLIMFFLYERMNEDGTTNFLSNEKGQVLKLENASDLYDIVEKIRNKK